jgi:serine/threonine protein kinase
MISWSSCFCSAEFKDIKKIGSGTFSEVFRATHRIDGMEYAIKRTKHPATSDSERNSWLQVMTTIHA